MNANSIRRDVDVQRERAPALNLLTDSPDGCFEPDPLKNGWMGCGYQAARLDNCSIKAFLSRFDRRTVSTAPFHKVLPGCNEQLDEIIVERVSKGTALPILGFEDLRNESPASSCKIGDPQPLIALRPEAIRDKGKDEYTADHKRGCDNAVRPIGRNGANGDHDIDCDRGQDPALPSQTLGDRGVVEEAGERRNQDGVEGDRYANN
jgi:hypothetical protein